MVNIIWRIGEGRRDSTINGHLVDVKGYQLGKRRYKFTFLSSEAEYGDICFTCLKSAHLWVVVVVKVVCLLWDGRFLVYCSLVLTVGTVSWESQLVV